jgi:hypothetical protein
MIILCEKKYAEERLQKGFKRDMSFTDLAILSRYWKHLGNTKPQIKKNLIDYCYKFASDFNEILYSKVIANALEESTKRPLRIFEPVGITTNEMCAIRSFPDFRYQKILFCAIVIAKHFAGETGRYYVNFHFTEIVKMAKVSVKCDERNSIMLDINATGLLTATDNDTFAVNCIDDDQSNPCLIVTDEKNIVSFLLFSCSICGKEIRMKSKTRKMCDECYKAKEEDRKIKNNYFV